MTISCFRTFLTFSQSYIFNFCKLFLNLFLSFLSFVCVLFVVVAVVVVVVVVVVMISPTFFTGCIQEAEEDTSPFCHSVPLCDYFKSCDSNSAESDITYIREHCTALIILTLFIFCLYHHCLTNNLQLIYGQVDITYFLYYH